jgi:pyridinium-3,5-biscarboxylic acid mononucleotide synthase
LRPEALRELLARVAAGELTPDAALAALAELPYADLGIAKPDLHRELRSGLPETIFGAGKRSEDLLAIAERLLAAHGRVLVTRVGPEAAAALCARFPDAVSHERARVVTCGAPHEASGAAAAVLAAGTSDLAVAEEAVVCLAWFGHTVERHYDVGVAGLHRLLDALPALRRAAVVVAVAGMDGALPAVVAGLVAAPVVAVPTSVGYGASFGGLAALLTMLNACAPGIGVVNIDNGYGAAVLAHRILRSASIASP